MALNRRRFRVLNQEPLELEAGDALVFEADSLCHGGAGLGPNEDMAACALFAYVGAVTKPVVTHSYTCEWETTAQWAQALTEEGLLAVLEGFAEDEDPIEGFAEDEDPIVEAIAELHRRLLTDEGALRLVPTARAAATILRSLRRAVALASSEQILAN